MGRVQLLYGLQFDNDLTVDYDVSTESFIDRLSVVSDFYWLLSMDDKAALLLSAL